jgi:adenylate cyclase
MGGANVSEQRVQRRLAAILAADVVGYSALMESDEAGTLARLQSLRADIIDPRIAEHGGRIVKTMGDGVLVEFPSAVAAVENALSIQRAMAEHEASRPEDRRIQFRVGINLGDVIIEGDDIHGDGVNVAARLEGLCKPGGVYISGTVHDHVEGKLAANFEDLGEKSVKNIARPVHVFEVRDAEESAKTDRADTAASLTLPQKPSIAVLPFNNMSGDPEQEYFSDGITEDIITALSRVRWFFVIARNTTFAYKGAATNVRAVADELGVGYVLEGSVRKAGERVRITAQLIDGSTGNHVWAERYDRELADIFDLQDEITETIVGAIEPELGKAERERAKAKHPGNLHAWDLYQRAMSHTYKRTRDDLSEAQRLFAQTIEIDPDLARAYAGAEEAYFFQVVGGFAEFPEAAKTEGERVARRAIELDDQDAFSRYALGRALILRRQHEAAIPELETAIDLNPSFAQAHYALGMALGTSGRPDEVIPHVETAMRLSPHDPYLGQFMLRIAESHLFMKRHEEAADWARRSLREPNPVFSRWCILISALGHLGRADESRTAVESFLQFTPDASIAKVRDYWPISDPDSMEHLLDGLRKAGLPE